MVPPPPVPMRTAQSTAVSARDSARTAAAVTHDIPRVRPAGEGGGGGDVWSTHNKFAGPTASAVTAHVTARPEQSITLQDLQLLSKTAPSSTLGQIPFRQVWSTLTQLNACMQSISVDIARQKS